MSIFKIFKFFCGYVIGKSKSINIIVELNKSILICTCYRCFVIAVCSSNYSVIFRICFCDFCKESICGCIKIFEFCSFVCGNVLTVGESLDVCFELFKVSLVA